MPTLTLPKPRGFSLQAAADFYAGFIPASGMAAASGRDLTLAFRLDTTFEAVVIALREDRESLVGDYTGTREAQTLSRQVTRMLGLDADGSEWLAIGKRDPVVGRLQAEFPGFFTAAKPSPYDAAVWGVIAPRLSIRAAAKLKMAMAELHGRVFPSPTELLRLESFPGLPAEKLERLKGIARAAIEGKLDADRLRAMNERDVLRMLQTLHGVGPWVASHILFRGAAPPDGLPTAEPRVLHGLAHAYCIESPSVDTFRRLAEQWRPFRMWVSILLARHLAKIGGWHHPELRRERALLLRV
jgi:DNA-3-methyladenine glycosylase II